MLPNFAPPPSYLVAWPKSDLLVLIREGINCPHLSDTILISGNSVEFSSVHQVFFICQSNYFESLFSRTAWKSAWQPGGRLPVQIDDTTLKYIIEVSPSPSPPTCRPTSRLEESTREQMHKFPNVGLSASPRKHVLEGKSQPWHQAPIDN